MMHNFSKTTLYGSLFGILATGLVLVGCDSDSNGGDGFEDSLTISGRVTDNAGFAVKAADIEGATVLAFEVNSQGTLVPAEGQATTNASGEYTLETDAETDLIVVTATKGSQFSGRTLVQTEAGADDHVSAMTINVETTVEANVFLKARQQQQNEPTSRGAITAGDVAFYVDSEVAVAVRSGAMSDSLAAAVIRAAINAEARSLRDDGVSDDDIDDMNERRSNAFLTLQGDLVASSNVADEELAISRLGDTMAEVMVESNIDSEAAARARLAGAAALLALSDDMSADARLSMRRRAESHAAMSTSAALFTEFEADADLQGSANNVATSGETLRLAIINSTNENEIDDAWDTFQTSVSTELSTALSIDPALQTVIQSTLEPFRIAYEQSLSAATTADEVVEARAEFTTNVASSLETALADLADAENSARVWALATIR